ncbi:hypothetical protein HXX76_000965 [Chlamydomonas incerta]|uniref:Uncharacterized protein n=1 Tax=Chlamydomonas incerta TaxID=51695 RepID=A0A835WFA7_CHLIN|nr:hypothetical protein HXX76_000965 [Chlamydomonas incerta]|eukprot:KAG2446380.1 hypothetical protein HXX76_000965 [Chlamydomonas incerta]
MEGGKVVAFGAQALGPQPGSAVFRHLVVELPPSPGGSQPPPSAPSSSRSLYPAAPAQPSARSLVSQASGAASVAPAGLSATAAAALLRLRDQQHKLQQQQRPQQQPRLAPPGSAYAPPPQAAYAQAAYPSPQPHQVQYPQPQPQYGSRRYDGATAVPQAGHAMSGTGGSEMDDCSAGLAVDTRAAVTAPGDAAADGGAQKGTGTSGVGKFGKALKALLKSSKSKKGAADDGLQAASARDAAATNNAQQALREAAEGAGRYVLGAGGPQLQTAATMQRQHSLHAARDNAAPVGLGPAQPPHQLDQPHAAQRHQLWEAAGRAAAGYAPDAPQQQQRQAPAQPPPPQQQRHQLWTGPPGADDQGRPRDAAATGGVSAAAYFQPGMPAPYMAPVLPPHPADPLAAPSLDSGASARPTFGMGGFSAGFGMLSAPPLAPAPLAAAGHAGGVATTLPAAYLQAAPPPAPQVAAKWQRLAVVGAAAPGSSSRPAGAATGGISTAEVEAAVRGSDLAFGRHGSSGIDLFAPGTLAMLRRQQQQQPPQPQMLMRANDGLIGAEAERQRTAAPQPGAASAAPPLPPGARDAAAAAMSEVILATTATVQHPQDLPRGLGPAPPPLPKPGKKGAAGGAVDKEGGKAKHKVPSEAGNVWTALVHRSNIGQVAQRLAASVPGSRRPTDSSGVSGSAGGASTAPPANAGQPSSGGASNSNSCGPGPSRRVSWGSDAGPAAGSHEERASAPTAPAVGARQLSGTVGSTSANFRAAAAALSQLPPRPSGKCGSATSANATAAGAATGDSSSGSRAPSQQAPGPGAGAASSEACGRAPDPSTAPGPGGAAPLQRYPAVPDGATAAARASALLAAQPAPAAGARSPQAYPAVPGGAGGAAGAIGGAAAAAVPDAAYLLGILSRLKTPAVIRQAARAAAAKAKAGTASAAPGADPQAPPAGPPAAAELDGGVGAPAAAGAADAARAMEAEAAGPGRDAAVYRRVFGRSVGLAWRHKALGYSKAGATASFHERSLSHKHFASGGDSRPAAADDCSALEVDAAAAAGAEAVAAADELDSDAYEDAVEDGLSSQQCSEGGAGADAGTAGGAGVSPSPSRAARVRAPPPPGSPPPQPLLQPHEAVQRVARDEQGRVVALAAAWDDYAVSVVTPRSGCGPGPVSAAASPSPAYRQAAASPPAVASTAASPGPQQAQQLAHAAAMWLGRSPRAAEATLPQPVAVTVTAKPPAGPDTADARRTPNRRLEYSGAAVATLGVCAAAGAAAVSPLSSAAAAAAANGLRSRYATATQDDGCGSSDPEEPEAAAGGGSGAEDEQEYCATEGEAAAEMEAPSSQVSGSSSVGSTRNHARAAMTPDGAAGPGHAAMDLAAGLATAASVSRPDRDLQRQQQRMNQGLFTAAAAHSPHVTAAGTVPGSAASASVISGAGAAPSPAFRTPLRCWARGGEATEATEEEAGVGAGGDTSSVVFASAATTGAALAMQSRKVVPEVSQLPRQLECTPAERTACVRDIGVDVTAGGAPPVHQHQQHQQQPELSEAVAMWGAVPSAPPLLTPGVCQQLPPGAAATPATAVGASSFALFLGAQGALPQQSAAATPQLFAMQLQRGEAEEMSEAAAHSAAATASSLERHWCRRSVGVAAAVHRQQSQRAFRTPASSSGGGVTAGAPGIDDDYQAQLEERAAAVIQARWRGIRSQRASLAGVGRTARQPGAVFNLSAAPGPQALQASNAGCADYREAEDDDDNVAAMSEAATDDSGFEDADAAEEVGVLLAQERLHTAAVLIQAAWRGHATRVAAAEARRLRQAELLAAAEAARQRDQELLEAEAAALELRKMETAAVVVQAAWRGRLARACVEQERQQIRALQWRRAEAVALRVQAAWRGLVARRRVERLRVAAAAARAAEEEARLRLEEEEEAAEQARQEAAATKVQAGWRGSRARASFKALRDERRAAEAAVAAAAEQAQREGAAAVVLQSAWRGFRDRAALSRLMVQRQQELALLQEQEEQARLHVAATAVQAAWRGRQVRAEVQRLREHQQVEAARQHAAAVVLQAAWRGRAARTAIGEERSRIAAEAEAETMAEAARRQKADAEAAAELEAQVQALRMNVAASRIQRAWSRRPAHSLRLLAEEEPAPPPAVGAALGTEGEDAEEEESDGAADSPPARAMRCGGRVAAGGMFGLLASEEEDDDDDADEGEDEQDSEAEEAEDGDDPDIGSAGSELADGEDVAAVPPQLRAAPLSFDDIPVGVRLPVPPAPAARRGPADSTPPAGPAGAGGLFVAVPVRSADVAGLAAAGSTPRGLGAGGGDAGPSDAAAAAAGGRVAMLISDGISIRFPAVSPGVVQTANAAGPPPPVRQQDAAFSDDDLAVSEAAALPRAPAHAPSPQRAAFALPFALLSSSEDDDGDGGSEGEVDEDGAEEQLDQEREETGGQDSDGLAGGAVESDEEAEAVDEDVAAQVAALVEVAAAAAAGLLAGDDPRVLLLGQVLEDPSPQAEWLRSQIAEQLAAAAAAEDEAAEAEAAAVAAVQGTASAVGAGMGPAVALEGEVSMDDSEHEEAEEEDPEAGNDSEPSSPGRTLLQLRGETGGSGEAADDALDEEDDEGEEEGSSLPTLRPAANPFALLGGDDSGTDEGEQEEGGSEDESEEGSPAGAGVPRRPANPFALLGEGSEEEASTGGGEDEDEDDGMQTDEGEGEGDEDEDDGQEQFSLDGDGDGQSPGVMALQSNLAATPMAAATGGAATAAAAAAAAAAGPTINSPFSFGFGGGAASGATQSPWLGFVGGPGGAAAAIGAMVPSAGGGGPATPSLNPAWPALAAQAANAAPGFGGLGQVWGAGGATGAASLFGNPSQAPTHGGGGLFGAAVGAAAAAPSASTAATSSHVSYSAFASAVGTEAALLHAGAGGGAALDPAELAAAATPMSRPRLRAQQADSPDGGYGGGGPPRIAAAADEPDAVSDASVPFLPYDSCTTTVAYNAPQRQGGGSGGSFAGRLAAAWGAMPEEGEGQEAGEEATPRHHGDRYRATSSPSVNDAHTATPRRPGAASGPVLNGDAARAGAWDSPATAFQHAAPHTLRGGGMPTTAQAGAAAGGVEQTPCSARVLPSGMARMQQQHQQHHQQAWGPSLGPLFAAVVPGSGSPGDEEEGQEEDEDEEDEEAPLEDTDEGEQEEAAGGAATAARPARRGHEPPPQLFAAGAAMLPSRLFGEEGEEDEGGVALDVMSEGELAADDEDGEADEAEDDDEGGASDAFEDAASQRAGACSSRGGSGFASACSSRRVSEGSGMAAPHPAVGTAGLAAAWSALGARGSSGLGGMEPGLFSLAHLGQQQAPPGQRPSFW